MSSTLNTPVPRRTGSALRSGGSGTEKVVEVDYLTNSDAYFERLQKLNTHAEMVRKHDAEQERKLIEYLPVNEKFNLNKEGKVIARWQERQRDWEKIQAKIKRRLTSKVQKPLMMATTDEYRARMEEYDLLQASIPLKDRFSSGSWQVTLRGGGPVRVAIGHIFSGIECEIDTELPKPKMVRKPKPMQAVGKNDTFVDQSQTYLSKTKKYQETIRDIRPHNLTYSEAAHLVIKSENLFKWARESSAQFYNERKAAEYGDTATVITATAEQAGAALEKSVDTLPGLPAAAGMSVVVDIPAPVTGSKIDFLAAKEVIFDCLDGQNCTKTVSFRNSGATAISYYWRRVPMPSSVTKNTDPSTLNGVLNKKGTDEGALRSRVLGQNRECFFCLPESGVVLPDETISTAFVFKSCTGGGSFRSEWILEFNPEETVVQSGVGAGADVASGAASPLGVGSVSLRLKGHCITVDESASKRAELAHFLDQSAITAAARDIVFSCLRRVRDPVRLKDLQNRQIAYFKRVNATLLEALSARFATMLPLFVTPERLELFVGLYRSASAAVEVIKHTLLERRAQFAALPGITESQCAAVGAVPVDESNPLHLSAEQEQHIRSVLFPENLIEIFDEVSEEQLQPAWGYDLGAVLSALEALLGHCHEIAALEDRIAECERTAEKARLKAERQAARRAAADSDDDEPEDEEEEEEEGEVDEEEEGSKPVHPFVAQVQGLVAEVHSSLHLLVTHPLPETEIYEIASEILGELAESVVDHHLAALEVCELKDMVLNHHVALPALPSPFTSLDGAAAWNHALAQTSHIAEPEPGAKKGAAPKPAKNAPPPTEPTKQQVDFYYKTLYNGLRGSFLDAGVSVFTRVDELLQKGAATPLRQYGASLENLFQVGAVRAKDLTASVTPDAQGRMAFVSFDGGAFSQQAAVRSAFETRQANKLRAIAPVLKLVEYGAKAVVLLYESPRTVTDPAADTVLPFFDELKNLISQQRADAVAKANRALRKLKQKPPIRKELVFYKYASFAEFYHHVDALLKEDANSVQKNGFFNLNIPIILLENIRAAGVVPPEPPLPELVEEDDEAPICIGEEESTAKRQRDWEARRPHRVTVTLDLTASAAKRGGASAKQQLSTARVECYAHAPSAIQEAIEVMKERSSAPPLWIDAQAGTLYDPRSDLPALDRKLVSQRLVSDDLREAYLWSGVLQLLPQAAEYLLETSQPAVQSSAEDGSIDTNTAEATPSAKELISQHFARLFPYSAASKKVPKAVVVLGGQIRAEKFAVLDQLIDLVDTIFLTGELAVAFLCLSQRYQFRRYSLQCARYHNACAALLAKARMRGCQLRWPVDMVMGDTEVTAADRVKCFEKVDPEARNEGADYEGEAKVFKVSDAEVDGGGTQLVVLNGYAYDLGPESCAALKAAVQGADLVVVWGTAGVCESGSFQAGQQCLVEYAAPKPPPAPTAASAKPAANAKGAAAATAAATAAPLTKNPLRTVLVGDATVEWFARIVDPDGELEGDLVGAGRVAYATRESSVFTGLMGLLPSRMVQGCLAMRAPQEGEFVYSQPKPPSEDEDEEDDEDEEEEDD